MSKRDYMSEFLHGSGGKNRLEDIKMEAKKLIEDQKGKKRERDELLIAFEGDCNTQKSKKLLKKLENMFAEVDSYEKMLGTIYSAADAEIKESEQAKLDALQELGQRLQRLPSTQPLQLSVFYSEIDMKEQRGGDEVANVKLNRDAQKRKKPGGRKN